jgi:hypothetical protein
VLKSLPLRILLTGLLMAVLSISCGAEPEGGITVSGLAEAGPVCPVETNPPDPACAPRPVVGAVVVAVAESGDRFETTTGPDGRFSFTLAAGGYEIIAEPANGLMGTPEPIEVDVISPGPIDVGVLMYDTGIR